jgi:hypothetical protein
MWLALVSDLHPSKIEGARAAWDIEEEAEEKGQKMQ